tara:strand:- start:1647 stop:1763 length:117 start_codon:yes stop_codon:yes gene_type:complete
MKMKTQKKEKESDEISRSLLYTPIEINKKEGLKTLSLY